MPILSVRIPQIGEGLQEARLVAVLKQPGERVRRDEPIYQMETDKAVMDVESPYEGVLTEWMAPVDSVLPIGGEVARMEVADGVQEAPAPAHGAPAPQAAPVTTTASPAAGARNANIPPRTRAYAKEKGLTDDQLAQINAPTGKLMPADIDAFLSAAPAPSRGGAFDETPLSQKQRVLSSRLVRGNQLCVPGTISCAMNWEPIAALREAFRAKGGEFQPSSFTMFAYAVAQALKEFPAFRSAMAGDSAIRTYHHAQLGIAVSLPGDELVTAVINRADALDWREFAQAAKASIDAAREGRDQVTEATTISLTNMQSFALRDAVPVVVPPAVATLFLGEVYSGLAQDADQPKLQKMANLALTFDHRVVNGVGAANFLNAVRARCERVGELIQP
ncbi:MAG: 2-oxo acid dehydrogenase subunit E2 [Fimbriimonas ginsengisoli]|uniref:Dihydrolipoamide acetyltransferase component of pyruvate dehydrogenase complex n=1 Tax=Fimbriimonas ginsengisoli TaxID=1005039 RepID=A0A931LVU1_FIMGI|nr:2-oxo acid dehydrogenase subunit E2 [Fimbriimonas ginsengisoli]